MLYRLLKSRAFWRGIVLGWNPEAIFLRRMGYYFEQGKRRRYVKGLINQLD